MSGDPISNAVWLLPYRDTASRENTIQGAQNNVGQAFAEFVGGKPRIREGYWYDLQGAGASSYSGSNELTFASSSNKYGFPDAVTLDITVPQSKVYAVYGVADYSANPSLQAMQITQNDVDWPLIYLSPTIYNSPDATAIFNGSMPPVEQNSSITITLYATAATTDKIDIKFQVAEKSAQTS